MPTFRSNAAAAAAALLLTLQSTSMLLPGTAPAAAPAMAPAPAAKVLHMFLSTSETGLDPAVASDIATLSLLENLFDPLLRYDYLARPLKLQGNTATGLPDVSPDGLTYTFHLRPGIRFTPDPAFKGAGRAQAREVTAQDYVYSITRLYDPALKSPWSFMFDGKLLGDAALKDKFNVDTAIPGLQALDRNTLRIRLAAPDNNFLFYLATPASSVVAREVIEAYPGQAGNHPVGTGPFMLGDWKRSDRIVLLANPDSTAVFHSDAFAGKGGTRADMPGAGGGSGGGGNGKASGKGSGAARDAGAGDRAIAAALEGQRLPRVDRVEIKIAEEFQGRMLGFLNGEYDYLEQVPESMTEMVIRDGALKPALAARGMQLYRFPVLQTYYMWMNMRDPVLGGYARERIALRRAIALSYDSAEDIALLKKGFAIKAESPLPPGVLGYDPAYRSPVPHDVALANALLDRYGYGQRDPDGFRRQPARGGALAAGVPAAASPPHELPAAGSPAAGSPAAGSPAAGQRAKAAVDTEPLTLVMSSEATVGGRLRDELWRKCLNAVGLRVVFKSDKKTEIIKASRLGTVQMFESNWIADFPDGDNFYQLLYGPNAGRANYARFDLPDYNVRYEQARRLTDGPARQKLYFEMNQLLHAYNPWVPLTHVLSADIRQPWLKNYKRHPVEFTQWRYLDVDVAERARATEGRR